MAQKKRPVTKSGRPRARKGVKLKPTELGPRELALPERPPELSALAEAVEADGGAVLAAYREPLGGHALLFVALPLDKVDRTSFQRDVSDAHVRRLTLAMDKTRRYLDPIIAVRKDGRYWTPNGLLSMLEFCLSEPFSSLIGWSRGPWASFHSNWPRKYSSLIGTVPSCSLAARFWM